MSCRKSPNFELTLSGVDDIVRKIGHSRFCDLTQNEIFKDSGLFAYGFRVALWLYVSNAQLFSKMYLMFMADPSKRAGETVWGACKSRIDSLVSR